MASSGQGEGKGKLILFGEHAVVYGCRAIACGLPRGAVASISFSDEPYWEIADGTQIVIGDAAVQKAGRLLLEEFDLRPEELTMKVSLEVPPGAGLGSSAAMAVAMARAAAALQGLDDACEEKVHRAVAASEAVFHGNASGIDQAAAMGEGFLSFRRGERGLEIEALEARSGRWIVARVAPSASTAMMVAGVAARRAANPNGTDGIFQMIESIAIEGRQALKQGDQHRLGELMNANHEALVELGVSSEVLDMACERARQAGAYGAKLTGAGGGGCILALVDEEHEEKVKDALESLGDVFRFTLP